MANTNIEVKKPATPAAGAPGGDVWHAMRHEIERLFDRFSNFDVSPFRRLSDIEHFWPRPDGGTLLSVDVDVAEDDKAYTITAELPGLDEKDIEVNVADDVLSIRGEKKEEREEKAKNYHLSERRYGSFQRTFQLPSGIDAEKIAASFQKGVLTVTLPKTPEAQKKEKKIAIQAK